MEDLQVQDTPTQEVQDPPVKKPKYNFDSFDNAVKEKTKYNFDSFDSEVKKKSLVDNVTRLHAWLSANAAGYKIKAILRRFAEWFRQIARWVKQFPGYPKNDTETD